MLLHDQFSLGAERQLGENLALRVGYVGTFGNDLFQTLDGNPRLPFSTQRQDPTRGVYQAREHGRVVSTTRCRRSSTSASAAG